MSVTVLTGQLTEPGEFCLDDFPAGCLVTDFKRKILYSNTYLEQRLGYCPGALADMDLFSVLSRGSQVLYETYLVPMLVRGGQCDEIQLSLLTQRGDAFPVVISARRGADNDERLFWSLTEASQREQMYRELSEARDLLQQKVGQLNILSDTDQLTGLPNRAAMSRHLGQQIRKAETGGLAFALAFVDLDGFKEVNDRYGHPTGDQLLRLVARRMANNLRKDDMIARFGGDEFVILLRGDLSSVSAEESLKRLLAALAEPFKVDTAPVRISASIGVTLYPQADNIEPDQLLRQADQAMYQAKIAGRNQICVFNVQREKFLRDRNEELTSIRNGLAQGQFELHYQPKVNMRTGEVLGAEALLRWHHPVQGLVGPASFLPAVDETPVGIELGRWVISTALAQLQEWNQRGLDLHVSINIAGYHLQHVDFLRDLGEALGRYPAALKHRLELEVLETSTIEDIDHVSSVLTACKVLGIRVALDDFGTGYSTLGHLRDLSVDVLKIDRSFVRDMLTNEGDLAILRGVIGFAQAFRCDVIAEGVETRQHGQQLIELGCENGQGYYIARPMPAMELEPWVRAWNHQEFRHKFASADARGEKQRESGDHASC